MPLYSVSCKETVYDVRLLVQEMVKFFEI